ncbi:SufE family protein [Litoribrevibacter albus]|uniref:Cysteine desulfurase, sulfur acceptor subunit CsdE n=1 Tax=Litoribrevibacter albus TaxID=1473156 RepID=A0AA37SB84_9GAMM|nr:SufE family protein [Litoribrevibacter albus]GLQ32041.1 cysteine desulfurase, sulfur acceptor subunit CsdE [Litoribrevibacter albus]
MSNPFGTEITPEEIVDTLGFFDSWEDRYRYIIDLGKQLPEMDDAKKTDDRIVKGCQSQVWIDHWLEGDKIMLSVDSDAHIVRGLLAVVMSAYNGKTPQQVLDFDIEAFFNELDLIKHLSPTRGNGLRSMVQKIRELATTLS